MLNITSMNPIERLQSGLSKLTSRKSTKDITALNSICNKDWPLDPNSYDLLDDCGRGVSATVRLYSHVLNIPAPDQLSTDQEHACWVRKRVSLKISFILEHPC